MSAVAFICPFCKDGQTVVAGDASESDGAFISHEEPYCTRFAEVMADNLAADEFLRLCRLRMSE